MLRLVFGLSRPRIGIRGTDVAGTVEAVGASVTQVKPGDEVFGWCTGGFAEYVSARATQFVAKPAGITFEQASGIPLAGCAAVQALRDIGKLQAGQTLLINGASGGIGTFAVQLGKAWGAEVTGVCSTGNVELVRSLGADHVIDYTQQDFTRSDNQYDVILDNVANHSLSALQHLLTPRGTLIPNSDTGGLRRVFTARLMSIFSRQTLRPFLSLPKHADLLVLQESMEAGKVKPEVGRTYPLAETAAAIRHVEGGHARGKVVITM